MNDIEPESQLDRIERKLDFLITCVKWGTFLTVVYFLIRIFVPILVMILL